MCNLERPIITSLRQLIQVTLKAHTPTRLVRQFRNKALGVEPKLLANHFWGTCLP
jgi:hypothetical protein